MPRTWCWVLTTTTFLSLWAAAGEELDPKAATPGFASNKKPGLSQHSSNHKRPATAPVGEELDEAANASDSPCRHPKRQRGADPAHCGSSGDPAAPAQGRPATSPRSQRRAPESSSMTRSVSPDSSLSLAGDAGQQLSPGQQTSGSKGLDRSPTHPQESPHIRQQQQHSGSSSGSSGSESESHPAAARQLPSWRQQEQQEPEEEAKAEASRAAAQPHSRSRPFSRSGSRTHNSAQPGNPDGVAGAGPHHRPSRPHHGSPKAPLHQSTNDRGPQERPPRRAGAGILPSAPDHRTHHRDDHKPDHRAADHRADYRASHRADHRADHGVDRRAQQPRPFGPSASLDRSDWQQPNHGVQEAGRYLPHGAHTRLDRQHPPHPQVLLHSPASLFHSLPSNSKFGRVSDSKVAKRLRYSSTTVAG